MKRSLFSNAVWNLVTGFSAAAVSLVVPPFFTRALSPESFGAWALALQMAGYVTILSFGLQIGVGRFVSVAEAAGDMALRNRVVAAAFWALLLSAILGVLGVSVLAANLGRIVPDMTPLLRDELAVALVILGLSTAVLLPSTAFAGVFNGLQRSDVPAKILATGRLLTAGSLVGAVVAGERGLIALASIHCAISVLTTVAMYVSWRRLTVQPVLGPRWITRETTLELAGFCLSLTVWNLAMLMVGGLDLLIVGRYDIASLAAFAVSATLATFVVGTIQSLSTPLVPASAELIGSPMELRALLATSSRFILMASLLVTVPLFLARELVLATWVGYDYVLPAAPLLGGLLVAAFVRNMMLSYVMIAIGTGRQHRMIVTPLVEGAICVVGGIFIASAIGAFGVIVAKLAGAVAGVALLLGQHALADRLDGMSRFDQLWRNMVRPLVVLVPVGLVALVIPSGSSIGWEMARLATIMSVLVAGIWFLGLTGEDRVRVLAMVRLRAGLAR